MNDNGENKEIQKDSSSLSENKKLNNRVKTISITIIIVAILWIFVLNPFITFKKNEKEFKVAAEKYFEMYSLELPTGDRVGEVSLQRLYEKGFLKEDFYVPYKLLNKTTCSVTDSWVKVTKDDGDYKYYTYLKCGALSSNVDHKGPKITLNGKQEMTVSVGEKFEDPGIKSIKDNTDGSIDIKKATISNKVNTNKMGTYTIKYSAIDSLKNKTEVTRKVTVVQRLNSTVKKATDNLGYYTGNPNNYIYFSNNLYRIVDVDGDNVRIVADRDISNVNHDGIDKWLEYYLEHINPESKKLIVKNKYCQMTIGENNTNTTECSNFSKNKEASIPSIVDINRAQSGEDNFLKPSTMSWTSDKSSDKIAYLTRNFFFNVNGGTNYMKYATENNFGVRPIITIKGDVLISSGNGSENNPYIIEDFEYGKADDLVNTRTSGEYISIDGQVWRIIEGLNDGTTKVIYESVLKKNYKYLTLGNEYGSGTTYSVKNNKNVGYKIANKTSEYVESKYFTTHEVEVPVYKDKAQYRNETKREKIKAKFVAPNMYEMFSAVAENNASYWYINSSSNENYKYGVADIGSAITEETGPYIVLGVRPVGYLNRSCIIVKGTGTKNDPYIIKK